MLSALKANLSGRTPLALGLQRRRKVVTLTPRIAGADNVDEPIVSAGEQAWREAGSVAPEAPEAPEVAESARSFLRWAGGKRWLLHHLPKILGSFKISGYHEPFLGGGAVFFGSELRVRLIFPI